MNFLHEKGLSTKMTMRNCTADLFTEIVIDQRLDSRLRGCAEAMKLCPGF